MTEVVAALIWQGEKFMICQRPAHKARGLLWEFVGGKVEPGETKEQALMGYDKGDIAFVIHYQMPSNIVSYYQQIGRAGRNIDKAYTFLMFGKEDEDILYYFVDTAFPTEKEATDVMGYISCNDGVKQNQIYSALNQKKSRLDKAISFLTHEGFIMKERQLYYATPKPFVYDKEHYEAVTATRIREMEQMKKLATTTTCYSKFVVECLDDHSAYECGHCANCLGRDILPSKPSTGSIHIAEAYINGLILEIPPRKRWPSTDYTGKINIPIPNNIGLCLAKYGDPGYGELVKRDKYSPKKRFCDELVGKSAKVLRPLVNEKGIKYITCVPSLRGDIVLDFSMRLAESLGLTFVELLKKSNTRQQKEMQNSSYQCGNAMHSFSLLDGVEVPDKVLLVDDVVDSRWTLTACGYYLSQGGCGEIYPFALADSSQKED